MNFQKLLDNIKHLPTTIVGAAGLVLLATQDQTIQQLAGLNPKLAHYVSAAGAIATGLTLIFGAGKK